jgi:CBS domain-containing protein
MANSHLKQWTRPSLKLTEDLRHLDGTKHGERPKTRPSSAERTQLSLGHFLLTSKLEENDNMHCKEIMSQDVQWILPDETVAGAAKLMAFHNVGFLPICAADGKPIGVITDRDIALRVVGEDRPAERTKVREVMTASVHTVAPDCPVDRIGEIMTNAGVSRLLVLDDGGFLDGIVSVVDLLVHAPGHRALETARGIYARETTDRSVGHPHLATQPTPEFFRGARDFARDHNSVEENPARHEAESVVHGGTNDFKEFPA